MLGYTVTKSYELPESNLSDEDTAELGRKLAAAVDKAFEDAMWGGPGRKERHQREWAESVHPPKPKPAYPKLVAKVINDKIEYFWDYGVFNWDITS